MKIKLTEWQEGDGSWHAADISAVGQGSSRWWLVPRALGMSLPDYVQMIITKYKPDRIKYFEDANVLTYSWKSQAAMRLFKNNVNKMLRDALLKKY
jgi:hypothetical protein